MGCVYEAVNLINGHSYIGKTMQTLHRRSRRHVNDAKRGEGAYFARAILKYGEDKFNWQVLFESDDQNELYQKEREFISLRGYYNLTDGGEGTPGYVPTPETRAKLAAASTGAVFSEERRKAISEATRGKKRKPLSLETKAKISAAHIGKSHKPMTDETRKKLSISNKGKKRSPETCEKVRLAKLGKRREHPSDETRAKISEAMKGRKFSEEHRKNISLSRKGKTFGPHTEEHNAKIGAGGIGKHTGPRPNDVRMKVSASLKEYYAKRKTQTGQVKDEI